MYATVFDAGNVQIDRPGEGTKKKKKRKRPVEQDSGTPADGELGDGTRKKHKKAKDAQPKVDDNSRKMKRPEDTPEAGTFQPGPAVDSPTPSIEMSKKKKKEKRKEKGNIEQMALDPVPQSVSASSPTVASAPAPLDLSAYETADDLLRAIKRIPRAKIAQSISGGSLPKGSPTVVPAEVAKKPKSSISQPIKRPHVSIDVQPRPLPPLSQYPPLPVRDDLENLGDHATLLSSRWLHTKQLKDLVENQGSLFSMPWTGCLP